MEEYFTFWENSLQRDNNVFSLSEDLLLLDLGKTIGDNKDLGPEGATFLHYLVADPITDAEGLSLGQEALPIA